MSTSADTKAQAQAVLAKLEKKTPVTDAELATLQTHVDDLEAATVASHHEDHQHHSIV